MTILLHLLWQSHPSLPNPKLTCQHSKALSTDCVNTAQFPPGPIFWVWDWNRIKSRSISKSRSCTSSKAKQTDTEVVPLHRTRVIRILCLLQAFLLIDWSCFEFLCFCFKLGAKSLFMSFLEMHSPWATGRKRSKALKTSPFSKAGPWEKTEMQKETGFFTHSENQELRNWTI